MSPFIVRRISRKTPSLGGEENKGSRLYISGCVLRFSETGRGAGKKKLFAKDLWKYSSQSPGGSKREARGGGGIHVEKRLKSENWVKEESQR